MGKKLEKERQKNFQNVKIGFLLELKFRQDFINEQLSNFIVFLEDNSKFLTKIDLHCITHGIDNFNDLFYNFTDLIYTDVDFNEVYCKFHKDFY